MRSPATRALFISLTLAAAAGAGWYVFAPGHKPLPPGTRVDRIEIDKSAHTMTVFEKQRVRKIYNISLGRGGPERKRQEGDMRTPEGSYRIDMQLEHSSYHKALQISYPNGSDRAYANRLAEQPGGQIMIHGLPNRLGFIGRLHLLADWTQGCIAVTNSEIDELWEAVPLGTTVEIRP